MRNSIIDLTGQRFERLLVESYSHSKNKRAQWKCRCDCGNETIREGKSLRNGDTNSCGCFLREKTIARNKALNKINPPRLKHGQARKNLNTKEYRAWSEIKRRCNSPKCKAYEHYGGRGIKLCERWKDFETFLSDIGEAPSRLHTIERVDNDKGYSPDNCIWATRKVQARNRRSSQKLTMDGMSLCVTEWAEKYSVSSGSMRYRLSRGMSLKDAIASLTS